MIPTRPYTYSCRYWAAGQAAFPDGRLRFQIEDARGTIAVLEVRGAPHSNFPLDDRYDKILAVSLILELTLKIVAPDPGIETVLTHLATEAP